MSLLDRIFKFDRELVGSEQEPEDPEAIPSAPPQLFEYAIEVKLLFWGNQTHYEVVTVQGFEEEKARLDGYYRVLNQFQSAIYGEATVLSCRKLGSDDV